MKTTAAKAAPTRLGVGLYSIPEVARIVGAPVATVRRWIDPREKLVFRRFDSEEKTISFLELMELYFIKMFRSQGVSLQTIRKAAAVASAKYKTNFPFAVRRFDTDGRTIFATLIKKESDTVVIEDLKKGQYVFDEILRPFFRKLEYRATDEAMRFWPLEMKGRVVLDPERHFGKPIDAETGIPTTALFQAIQTGEEMAGVAEWFQVPIEAVQWAVRFEESLAV